MRSEQFQLSDDFVFEIASTGRQFRAMICEDGKYYIDYYHDEVERYIAFGSWSGNLIAKNIDSKDWKFVKYIRPPVSIPDLSIGDLI